MSINKERAWETLKALSFERVTGTEDEKRAAELLKSICEKAGVEAWLEPYEIVQTSIDKVELSVLGENGRTYNVIGVGGSGSTPDEGIVAPFVYIEDASDATLGYVKGKIAVTNGMVNAKTTAVRIIPAPGCTVGDTVEFGGLLGSAPVQPVHPYSAKEFVSRGGRIPAPMQSLKN